MLTIIHWIASEYHCKFSQQREKSDFKWLQKGYQHFNSASHYECRLHLKIVYKRTFLFVDIEGKPSKYITTNHAKLKYRHACEKCMIIHARMVASCRKIERRSCNAENIMHVHGQNWNFEIYIMHHRNKINCAAKRRKKF